MKYQWASKLIRHFDWHDLIMRRALRMAIAMFISVLIYRVFSLTQGLWVPLTVIIVMQATTAATLRKGLQRLLGTFAGVIIGSLLIMKMHNSFWLDFFLIFFVFIAYELKQFTQVNYGIFVIPVTIMVVFLVSALVPQESHALILARLYDTALGGVISILVTFFVFPNTLKQRVNRQIHKTLETQYHYFHAIVHFFLNKETKSTISKNRVEFEQCLLENQLLYADWVYELGIKLERKHKHQRLLALIERMGQFLFSLHYLATQHLSPALTSQLQSNLMDVLMPIQLPQEITFSDFRPLLEGLERNINRLKQIKAQSPIEDQFFMTTLIADLQGYLASLYELEKYLPS